MTTLEDSPDLGLDEVASAVAVDSAEALARHLRGVACPTCQGRVLVRRHSFRRRHPHHYWRVELRCLDHGHDVRQTYRMDWTPP